MITKDSPWNVRFKSCPKQPTSPFKFRMQITQTSLKILRINNSLLEKTRSLLMLLLVTLLLSNCSRGAEVLSYTETLDNLHENNQINELFKNLIKVKRSTIEENLDWLKIKISTEDSRYFYAYSRNL